MKNHEKNQESKGNIFRKLIFLLCVGTLAFALAQSFFEFEVRTKDNNLYSELSQEMDAIVSETTGDLTEEEAAAVQLSVEEMFASGSSVFDPNGDNTVIYGHHMDNGTMFSALLNYVDYGYWADHSLVELRGLWSTKEYEVVFAFYEDVDEDYFQFHQFIYAKSQEDFDEFVVVARRVQ